MIWKKECANYLDGNCMGANINPDLSQYIDKDMMGKCNVKKEPCEYFEKIVNRGRITMVYKTRDMKKEVIE